MVNYRESENWVDQAKSKKKGYGNYAAALWFS